jgi:cytochrome P450
VSAGDSVLPPGPPWPSWIQLLGTWTRPAGVLLRLRAHYGKRFTVQLPFRGRFVVISDPGEIRELFGVPPDVVHPGEGTAVIEPVVGSHSLLLLDEDIHLEHRRLLLPAFHGERMAGLAELMRELTDAELERWPIGEAVALLPRLQRLTLEIILRAVFGLDAGPRLDALRESVTELLAFSENPVSIVPALQRYLGWTRTQQRFLSVRARTDELIAATVADRRRALAADPDLTSHASDVLAMLLAARHEDGSEMSGLEIRDELVTALVAGHETTASQLAWLFMRLAREPRVRVRVRAELAETDGRGGPYLVATIQEIQRLHPVVANAEPRIVKAPVTIGGITYPPGVAILASNFLSGRDRDLYPDPHAFRPERFLDQPPGTYTWTPFGGGRRRCIGAAFAQQEMRIVAAGVLSRFELLVTSMRLERARRRAITLSPVSGATMTLVPLRGDGPRTGIGAVDGSSRPAQAL